MGDFREIPYPNDGSIDGRWEHRGIVCCFKSLLLLMCYPPFSRMKIRVSRQSTECHLDGDTMRHSVFMHSPNTETCEQSQQKVDNLHSPKPEPIDFSHLVPVYEHLVHRFLVIASKNDPDRYHIVGKAAKVWEKFLHAETVEHYELILDEFRAMINSYYC